MEPTPKNFLEHAVRNSTQYTAGWRQVCQELLDARARIEALESNVRDLEERHLDVHAWADHIHVSREQKEARVRELEAQLEMLTDAHKTLAAELALYKNPENP